MVLVFSDSNNISASTSIGHWSGYQPLSPTRKEKQESIQLYIYFWATLSIGDLD